MYKDKLGGDDGIEIGPDHFNHIRAQLKRNVKKNLEHLQKDRFAYIQQYFDSIEEIRFIQKMLWKIIKENPDKPFLQRSCLSGFHQSTITLCTMYDVLPAISGLRLEFDNTGIILAPCNCASIANKKHYQY